jgi:hypothetical protein
LYTYVRYTSTRYTPPWVDIWEVHVWEMYVCKVQLVVAWFPQRSMCSKLRSNPAGFKYCAFLRPAFIGV